MSLFTLATCRRQRGLTSCFFTGLHDRNLTLISVAASSKQWINKQTRHHVVACQWYSARDTSAARTSTVREQSLQYPETEIE